MRKEPFMQIEAEEAATLINQGVIVIDVRQDYEYAHDHIESALLVPITEPYDFALDLAEKQLDKEQPILFVCEVGQRSATASLIAAIAGYSQVYNLAGGMNMWRYMGLPIIKNR